MTPAAVRVGYVTADAAPWAEVLLDGKVLDRTPFVRYPTTPQRSRFHSRSLN